MGSLRADPALSDWARDLIQRLGAEHSFARGWQSRVAEKLEISRNELSKIMRGKRAIDWSVAVRLARCAGIELRFYEAPSESAHSLVNSPSSLYVAKQVAVAVTASLIAEKKIAVSDEIRRLLDELETTRATVETKLRALRVASWEIDKEMAKKKSEFEMATRGFADKQRWFEQLDYQIDAQRKILHGLRAEAYALRRELDRSDTLSVDRMGTA